jgi:phosphoribosylaminoimidazole-succinocarboxamide synthase
MLRNSWKSRAQAAEAAAAQAKELLEGLALRLEDRAALISIVRDGRKLRFGFVRNGKLTYVECMGTWDDDVDAWKRELLK